MGRSRCAIRQGALFGAQAQRAPSLFSRLVIAVRQRTSEAFFACGRLIELSAQPNTSNIFIIRSLASRLSSFTTFCCVAFRKRKCRNFMTASLFYLLRVLDVDRGWSMTLSSAFLALLFAPAIAGITQPNDQQAQQSCVNAAICLLAVRSAASSRRRFDLQVHYTSLALGDRRGVT